MDFVHLLHIQGFLNDAKTIEMPPYPPEGMFIERADKIQEMLVDEAPDVFSNDSEKEAWLKNDSLHQEYMSQPSAVPGTVLRMKFESNNGWILPTAECESVLSELNSLKEEGLLESYLEDEDTDWFPASLENFRDLLSKLEEIFSATVNSKGYVRVV